MVERRTAKALALLALLALVALLGAAAAPARGDVPACTLYASPKGDDGANGSAAHPFRTTQKLVQALPDNGVGCLSSGGGFVGRVVVTHPVTLRTSSGRHAVVVGGVTVLATAAGTAIQNLTIHGQGSARAAVFVEANGVQVTGNTIDGDGYHDQNTACVFLDRARDTLVDSNRISACTRATRHDLSAPGVFAGSSYGARITNNLITHTVGYGISLGPNAQHSRVVHNIVDGSVGGVLIDGNATTASSYNVVEDNIFSNAGQYNVHAVWGGPVGKSNAVVSNCLWHGVAGNLSAPGVATLGNVVASPRYAKRPTDYTITGGPCVAKRPSFLATKLAALSRFTVGYSLRALPKKVQLVGLQLTHVTPGAHVDVRCASGCSAHWTGVAGTSTVSIPVLKGSWLPIGAEVDVRLSKTGHAGAYARLTVVGLPHGVTVSHACLAPGGTAPVSCAEVQ